jgi:Bacterial cell division membrane protein
MTTKRRRTTTGRSSPRRRTTPRRTTTRRTSTTPRSTTRRRTSTASTLGTAVGAALAGVITALIGRLPWWVWVLLIVGGLVIGLVWAARRAQPENSTASGAANSAEVSTVDGTDGDPVASG